MSEYSLTKLRMENISERQIELMTAAGKILSNSGVNSLTIKNLALEMKFSESAIYRHFKSKEDIIVSMLDYIAKQMELNLNSIPEGELSVEQEFLFLFEQQFQFFKSNPHFTVAVFLDGLVDDNMRILDAIKRIMETRKTYLKPIIKKGQEQGVFRNDISLDDALHIVMGAVRLQMFKWRISNFQFDISIEGQKIINAVFKILKSN